MTVPACVDDFDYSLPPNRIAQEPAPTRDASRLMALHRSAGVPAGLRHLHFSDLPSLLRPGDLLVVNDTRVRPARLSGRRAAPGTGGKVEALLIEQLPEEGNNVWRALLKGGCRENEPIEFGYGLRGRLLRRSEESAVVELSASPEAGTVEEALEVAGRMPTPPYIKRGLSGDAERDEAREGLDRERYQTVFARHVGAVAAPTAGLHFTSALIEAIRAGGVEVESLTLHVGIGTFQPVRVERVADHRMQPEPCFVPESVAAAVERVRQRRGRVVAVGTTVTRALEWRAGRTEGFVEPGYGMCDLFIHPGFRFRVVDALITNFHLPRSTLLMLVSAFAGRDIVLAAYAAAIEARYRFYSYGDAMFID